VNERTATWPHDDHDGNSHRRLHRRDHARARRGASVRQRGAELQSLRATALRGNRGHHGIDARLHEHAHAVWYTADYVSRMSDKNRAILEQLRAKATSNLADTLGITLRELTAERVVATMPVDQRTMQPFGLLHGGASVALAETVASLAGAMNVDLEHQAVVGIEINANHLRAKRDGVVTATATPVHVGRSTHVWAIRIVDETDRAICISRCTLAVVPREKS
jgi:1,4-dihydroxy-2-naphthoyl-CoA hydrolase